MAAVTIRNLPDEVHRALKVMAAKHGRSTEAEVRTLIETYVLPSARLRMGTALADIGRHGGLTHEEAALIEQRRDQTPAEPMRFE